MKALFRLRAAMIVALLFIVIGIAANAQPCTTGTLVINNNSPLNINICVVAAPPIRCVFIPAGLAVAMPIANPTAVTGVTSSAGINYPWAPNPTPPPALAITSISLPPTGFCFDVTYDPGTCTINVALAGPPPCVNP